MKLQELLLENDVEDRVVDINELSSGGFKSAKAHQLCQDVFNKILTVLVKEEDPDRDREAYKVVKRVTGVDLTKGMILFAEHNSTNQGANIYKFNGITDKKNGEDKILFDSVKELLKAKDCRNLLALEKLETTEKVSFYLNVTDVESMDSGSLFYLYGGRWCYGSGAEQLSWGLVKRVGAYEGESA